MVRWFLLFSVLITLPTAVIAAERPSMVEDDGLGGLVAPEPYVAKQVEHVDAVLFDRPRREAFVVANCVDSFGVDSQIVAMLQIGIEPRAIEQKVVVVAGQTEAAVVALGLLAQAELATDIVAEPVA